MGNGEREVRSWELVSEEFLGDFEMFRVRRRRVRSPRDGSEHDFHVADSPTGVTVIALTSDGRMVMVEQFRQGTREPSLEMPAGIVDEGESPEEAAARELREETGYEGGPPEVIGSIDVNPSWQETRVHVAVVQGARRAGEKELDGGEDTLVRLVDAAEVRERVARGEIRSAVAVAALALWEWTRNGAGRGG